MHEAKDSSKERVLKILIGMYDNGYTSTSELTTMIMNLFDQYEYIEYRGYRLDDNFND